MRRTAAVSAALLIAFGLSVGSALAAWPISRPVLWLPDAAVGLTFAGAATASWSRSRGAALLLGAVALTWWSGSVFPIAVHWHRAVLIHLLLAYPRGRPSGRPAISVTVLTYLVSAVPGSWSADLSAVALSALVLAVLITSRIRASLVARRAAAALTICLTGVAVASRLSPPGAAVVPSLLSYEAVLIVIAVLLWSGLRTPKHSPVTDLVVEIGAGETTGLRAALASILRDPSLQLGTWDETRQRYLNAEELPVTEPPPGSGPGRDQDRC